MAYKRIFVDSDVLLDQLLYRQPFSDYTKLLLIEKNLRGLDLFTSTLVIANIHYILAKKIGSKPAAEALKNLVKIINVLPFETDIISMAFESPFNDFEDGIQNSIAQRYKCEAIITRNIKDYKQSELPVYTTEQFLTHFN